MSVLVFTSNTFANGAAASKLPAIMSLLLDEPQTPEIPDDEKDELADINADGVLNLLVLGSSKSIKPYSSFNNNRALPFTTRPIAEELQMILSTDPNLSVSASQINTHLRYW